MSEPMEIETTRMPMWKLKMAANPLPDEMMPTIQVVRFVVGNDELEFALDTAKLFNMSGYFNKFLNDEDLEKFHEVVLDNVDPEIFACFEQFVNTGQYTEPVPTTDTSVRPGMPAEDDEHSDEDINEPCEDFTLVYLRHALVYEFASEFDIPALETHALDNLSDLLDSVRLYPERTKDIVELIRYVYKDTVVPGMKLRVARYSALNLPILGPDPSFVALFNKYPEFLDKFVPFAADIVDVMIAATNEE